MKNPGMTAIGIRLFLLAAAALGAAGCGPEGGAGSDSGGSSGGSGVTLQGLSVTPSLLTIVPGRKAALKVEGLYSNGAKGPVEATWSGWNPARISLNSSSGGQVTVTALSVGSITTVTATFEDRQASALVSVVEWATPDDPGPVFATGYVGGVSGVYRYPSGGGAPEQLHEFPGGYAGIAMNSRNDTLYAMCGGAPGMTIARVDVATGSSAEVAYGAMGWFGCCFDSKERLYAIAKGDTLTRFDPADNSITTLGPLGNDEQTALAIGPDDTIYSSPIMPGYAPMIYRQDLATGTAKPWAVVPDLGQTLGWAGFVITGGLAMNYKGEAYWLEFSGPDVYKAVDLNGDGDAGDAGEVVIFGSLPMGQLVLGTGTVYGLGLAGGRSLLVNVDPMLDIDTGLPTMAGGGIYWMADRNLDGDANDEGEVTLFNGTPLANGANPNCVTAAQ